MMVIAKKNSRGFTLIEVMVVIAIMSIMAGVVTVSFTGSRAKREVETNAREFASVVREAQNYALTGKKIGGNTACAFYVIWTVPSTYKLEYTHRDASDVCTSSSTNISTYNLKNGVKFSTNGSLNFTLPHANLSTSTSATFTKGGSSHTVCISLDGRVSDKPGGSC